MFVQVKRNTYVSDIVSVIVHYSTATHHWHLLKTKKIKIKIGNYWVFIPVLDFAVSFQIVNKSLSNPVAKPCVSAEANKSTKSSVSEVHFIFIYFFIERRLRQGHSKR